MNDQSNVAPNEALDSTGESTGDAITSVSAADIAENSVAEHQLDHNTSEQSPGSDLSTTGSSTTADIENSEETPTKKEEASNENHKRGADWKREIERFLRDVNGVLATKENLKLVAVDKKLHTAYSKNWKRESNRYFQLLVNLRRRASNTKTGGKTVA